MSNDSKLTRRELLKAAAVAGVGLTAGRFATANGEIEAPPSKQQTMIGVKFEPRDVVRIGMVGVGLRGTDVLGEFLAIDKVVINAVCDVVNEKCVRAARRKGRPEEAGDLFPW